MKQKIGLWTIFNKVDNLEKLTKNAFAESYLSGFRPIDYRDYFTPDSSHIKIWKYNGTYFNNPSPLYEIALTKGYVNTRKTWGIMANDEKRQSEL